MPYKLQQSGAGYTVVNSETGRKHSKRPLPRKRAVAQMRALYAAEKDASATAGAPLHGPGGLLGAAGLGGRPRKWGNPTRHPDCTCGVNVATKEQIAPGITRIRGNLCNVHGRYGPCDAAQSGKKPKGRKAGAGRAKKPKKPVLTPEQRAAARSKKQAENRSKVLAGLGIAPDGQQALEALRNGQQADSAAIARGGFVKAGLVEQAEDGSYRLTSSGRAMLGAASQGDAGRAGDTISGARDRTSAREQRKQAAAERKKQVEERRKKAAERAKQRGAGGGKQGSSAASSREAERAKRESERLADRAQRQREHEQDRAQRQREHAEDRARQEAERQQRQRQTATPPPAPQAPRVSSARPAVQLPKRRRGNAVRRAKSFTVFKSADGHYRWIARSTTAYRDRDGEIITTKALDADAARMAATQQYGPLRYWHLGEPNPFDVAAPWGPGVDIGACDYSTVIGRTSIESGTFTDVAIGKAFAESADDYELSPGFFHPPDQPNAAGEYANIRRFERSVVPIKYGRASNLFTGLTVKDHTMDQQTYEARVKAFMADMRAKDVPPEVAAASLAGMEQADKSAQEQGIAFKSDADPWQAVLAALKAAVVPQVAEKAPMAPASMEQAGATEQADGEMEAGQDDEGAEETEYIGDMSVSDFEALLTSALQAAIQSFGSDISTRMAAMDEAVKGMGYARTKAESTNAAEIAALKARLAELEGSQPAVVQVADIEAALKGAPEAPPDPTAPPKPANAVQAAAMRTFPQLYQQNADGSWGGWQPQPPLAS